MTYADLKACQRHRNAIESLQERIQRLRSQAERYSRPLSLAPSSGSAVDYLPGYAAKLDELQRELQEREIAYQEHLDMVDWWISGLPEQQAKVMRLRYVNGLRWKDVARRSHYSIRHCTRIQSVAVKKMTPNVHK